MLLVDEQVFVVVGVGVVLILIGVFVAMTPMKKKKQTDEADVAVVPLEGLYLAKATANSCKSLSPRAAHTTCVVVREPGAVVVSCVVCGLSSTHKYGSTLERGPESVRILPSLSAVCCCGNCVITAVSVSLCGTARTKRPRAGTAENRNND